MPLENESIPGATTFLREQLAALQVEATEWRERALAAERELGEASEWAKNRHARVQEINGELAEALNDRDAARHAADVASKAHAEAVRGRDGLLAAMSAETLRLGKALDIARQMANCVYNAKQTDWERAKVVLVELLPQFDAALTPVRGGAE